ncbi:forkhead box protein O4-like [Cloeon dipterum]|uniref:forkhead box protein O4-like n=1 Tax=Cloeon dipterum TaxID=197152 RepID=UPI00321FB485
MGFVVSAINERGKETLAELIAEAIESSPEKKLQLGGIYQYLINHKPYFQDLAGKEESRGWKNSIRHTLSFQKDKFEREPGKPAGLWKLKAEQPLKRGRGRPRKSAVASNQTVAQNVTLALEYQVQEQQTLKEYFQGFCPYEIEINPGDFDFTSIFTTPMTSELEEEPENFHPPQGSINSLGDIDIILEEAATYHNL